MAIVRVPLLCVHVCSGLRSCKDLPLLLSTWRLLQLNSSWLFPLQKTQCFFFFFYKFRFFPSPALWFAYLFIFLNTRYPVSVSYVYNWECWSRSHIVEPYYEIKRKKNLRLYRSRSMLLSNKSKDKMFSAFKNNPRFYYSFFLLKWLHYLWENRLEEEENGPNSNIFLVLVL